MKTLRQDKIEDTEVSEIFKSYPPTSRRKLLFLRTLFLNAAIPTKVITECFKMAFTYNLNKKS